MQEPVTESKSLLDAASLALEVSTWAQEQGAVWELMLSCGFARALAVESLEQAQQQLALGQAGERLLIARDFSGQLLGVLPLLRKTHAPVRDADGYRSAVAVLGQAIVSLASDKLAVLRALLQMAQDVSRELHVSSLECAVVSTALEPAYQSVGFERDQGGWRKLLDLNLPIARVGAPILAASHPAAMLIGSKTRSELVAISGNLLQQAHREVCIYSRDLDPLVLNQSEMLEHLRRLSIQAAARIRVLVQDSSRAQQDGHRLLELARRMSSAFEFRSPQAEDLQYPAAFMLNDRSSFIYRPLASRFDSEGNVYDSPGHDRLKRYFDEVWERSPPTLEFRRLSI